MFQWVESTNSVAKEMEVPTLRTRKAAALIPCSVIAIWGDVLKVIQGAPGAMKLKMAGRARGPVKNKVGSQTRNVK